MAKVFISGLGGFLGGNIVWYAKSKWKLSGSYYSKPNVPLGIGNKYVLDIRDQDNIIEVLRRDKPDIVIHTAAMSNFQLCESNSKMAWEVNVKGTKNIVIAANQIKAKFVYISTDLIFDGQDGFYTEQDKPNPINLYGKSKYEGEKIVTELSHDYCIVRSSLLYGWSRNSSKCFTEKIIGTLMQGKIINLFIDEYRSPIYVENFCNILMELVEKKQQAGVYNVGGPEKLNRFEIGLAICDVFKFSKNLISPIFINDLFPLSKRPLDCSMNSKKISNLINMKPLNILEGLAEMKKEMPDYQK